MGGAKRSTWIGGTVFIALVMMAGAWLLIISPILSDAVEVRTQAEDGRQQNELLVLRLAQLEADFAKLPEYEATLAELQQGIPADAELSSYLRQLDVIAMANNVVITSVTPSPPQAMVVAGAPAAAPTATTTEESTEEAAAGADASAAPTSTGSLVPSGLTTVPMSVTVVGTYENAVAFTYALQNSTARLFLVDTLGGTLQREGESMGGRPATALGDIELIITGYAYVLPDNLGGTEPTDPEAPAAVPPAAVPGKNPLVPIPGR